MNIVKSVVIVETAPSFEQISQSITDLLMDSADDDNAADEMFSSAALSGEYQQISTWCWVNIRVCLDALSSPMICSSYILYIASLAHCLIRLFTTKVDNVKRNMQKTDRYVQ